MLRRVLDGGAFDGDVWQDPAYGLVVGGRRRPLFVWRDPVGSATQLLTDGLALLEERWPGVLEKLTQVKKRTKRPVARRREDLYDAPHPPAHSVRLSSGYFVATNNKADEVLRIMRRALLETGAAETPDRQVRRA